MSLERVKEVMCDSSLDVVGVPPEIVGERCQAFLCQQYWYQEKFVEAALSIFLKFDSKWYRLFLDFNTVFWRLQEEEPQSWAIPEKGFNYPVVNLGEFLQIEGTVLSSLIFEPIEAELGVRATFVFENGCVAVFENRNDTTSLLVKSGDTKE